MSGNGGPCPYINDKDDEFLEAIFSSCPSPIPTAAPSSNVSVSVMPNGGRFSVTPSYPATCWSPTVGYSSTKPLKTGSILIDPGTEWGKVGSVWHFSASGGVRITNLTGTSDPDTGDLYSGRPVVSNNNFTHNSSWSWDMTVVPNMPTLPLIAIAQGTVDSNGTFPMTITSTVPCDKPTAYECNATNHDLSPDQWEAFRTDKFLADYIHNFTNSGGGNFFERFVDDFVGDAFATACQVDNDNGCGPLTQSCEQMKETPWRRQAYMVLASMITVNRWLSFMYRAYGQSDGDLGDILPEWENYFDVPKRQLVWQNVVAISASVIGMLSTLAFGIGPFAGPAALAIGAAGAVLFGVGTILNGAINVANANGAAVTEEIQFDDYGRSLQAMHNYIAWAQNSTINTANAYFKDATNLTDVLKGGIWLGDNMLTQVTESDNSGAVTQAAQWFDKQSTLGLINEAWKAGNNYIVFMPYGTVGHYGKGTVDFNADTCRSYFQGNGKWNSTIYSCCDCGPQGHEGMAVYMV